MKITINGNLGVNRYYVQSLCQLFFPGEKFSEKEEIGEDTPVLELGVDKTQDGESVSATAVFTLGDKTVTESSELEIKKSADEVKQAKKDGYIDQFIYGSISATYLADIVDSL